MKTPLLYGHFLFRVAVQSPHGHLAAPQGLHRAAAVPHHKAVLGVDIQRRHRFIRLQDVHLPPQIQAQLPVIVQIGLRGTQVTE